MSAIIIIFTISTRPSFRVRGLFGVQGNVTKSKTSVPPRVLGDCISGIHTAMFTVPDSQGPILNRRKVAFSSPCDISQSCTIAITTGRNQAVSGPFPLIPGAVCLGKAPPNPPQGCSASCDIQLARRVPRTLQGPHQEMGTNQMESC